MSPQERLTDSLVTRQLAMLRYATGRERAVVELLEDLLADVSGLIAKSRKPTLQMLKLQSDLELLLWPFDEALPKILDLERLTGSEMAYASTALDAALGAKIATTVAASRAVAVSEAAIIDGTPVADWMGGYSAKLKSDIVREVRLGMAAGQTMPQIADRMQELLQIKKSSARTMARTLVLGASNHARNAVWSENTDIIQGWIHKSTLDSRTTKICAVRDNLAWTLNYKPVGHNQVFRQPPLHPNCRSIPAPWLFSAADLPKAKRALLSKSTRASMDGQVDEAKDFEQFLNGKPEKFQIEWFGPGRYELYKSGKINFHDLVDARGRELSISELEKL